MNAARQSRDSNAANGSDTAAATTIAIGIILDAGGPAVKIAFRQGSGC